MSADALESFVAKWSAQLPELALALRFASASERPVWGALLCLFEEISDATYRIPEREVAARKLHWWAEELGGLSTAQARHPLSEVLQGHGGLRSLSPGRWTTLLQAALSQSDQAPAATLDDLLATYRRFSEPMMAIAASVQPLLDQATSARAHALSRAFRDCTQLEHALSMGRLPLPLDLLARHRLSRSDLAQPGNARNAALRDHCETLVSAMRAFDPRGLAVVHGLALQLDRARCRAAIRASDPLAALATGRSHLPLSSVWHAWRAARRLQAGT
jgi:phytoene synthase